MLASGNIRRWVSCAGEIGVATGIVGRDLGAIESSPSPRRCEHRSHATSGSSRQSVRELHRVIAKYTIRNKVAKNAIETI